MFLWWPTEVIHDAITLSGEFWCIPKHRRAHSQMNDFGSPVESWHFAKALLDDSAWHASCRGAGRVYPDPLDRARARSVSVAQAKAGACSCMPFQPGLPPTTASARNQRHRRLHEPLNPGMQVDIDVEKQWMSNAGNALQQLDQTGFRAGYLQSP